jgi:O-acetyl-ADP-ribose deacetylase (regulator of RNase III)
MIHYVVGDLLQGGDDIIIHGCNCFQTMGSGVAKHIRAVYPEAYDADCKYGESGDKKKLGTYSSVQTINKYTNKPLVIINAYTQYTYNVKEKPFDYDAFLRAFQLIISVYSHTMSIGMPKIGSGLAGGDWIRIERLIIDVLRLNYGTLENSREVTIYKL